VVLAVLVAGALVGFYIAFLTNGPTPYRVPVASASTGGRTVNLTLQTVAAVGSKLAPNKNWASGTEARSGHCRRTPSYT